LGQCSGRLDLQFGAFMEMSEDALCIHSRGL
jgi:hypothetical protein